MVDLNEESGLGMKIRLIDAQNVAILDTKNEREVSRMPKKTIKHLHVMISPKNEEVLRKLKGGRRAFKRAVVEVALDQLFQNYSIDEICNMIETSYNNK